jgi:hypothetical protein
MFEGRRTVTERTLADGIGFMARTDEDILATTVREHARLVYRIAYSGSWTIPIRIASSNWKQQSRAEMRTLRTAALPRTRIVSPQCEDPVWR